VAFLFVAALASFAQEPAEKAKPDPAKVRSLPTDTKAWKGDFDGMLESRNIRVLVPYSRTLYFNDKGRERGVLADNVRDFEAYINKKYRQRLGNRPITGYLIPTPRHAMLQTLPHAFSDIHTPHSTPT